MIQAPIGPDVPHFRFLTPRWAYMPLSGAGAARMGGRLNRPGTEALYLSASLETAAAEYQQTDALLQPGTVAAYLVTLERVVDFRAGFREDLWDSAWTEIWCEWRHQTFVQRIEPPSGLLQDLALDAGACGILYPSRAHPGGTNLVIYPGRTACERRDSRS